MARRQVPKLEFYNQLCPRKPRLWNVHPRISTGACTQQAFPGWTHDDHFEAAMHHKHKADAVRKAWYAAIDRAVARYGDQGPLISGGLREHWPRQTKDTVRKLARATGGYEEAHHLHWAASGKRMRGWSKGL